MSSILEIEAAIEKLPAPQVDELAAWLEALRLRREVPAPVEVWLNHSRGTARPGVKSNDVLALTREEQ